MAEGLLTGYKVLDLGHYVAGPYCTKLMAGLGAEVIKIERPRVGDGARHLGPFYQDELHPEKSLPFLYLNTGKKGITLNLKTELGKNIFKDLAREADALVENFRPGVMSRLGLDYEVLEQVNPRLVMTSISNFGQTGPFRHWKAVDLNEMAWSGVMYGNGEPDREPLAFGGFPAQYQGGMNAFTATLCALYWREMSGQGQHIDISLLESLAVVLEQQETQWAFAQTYNPRSGTHWLSQSCWGTYPCQDGHVCVVGFPAARQRAIGTLIGRPEWNDPKYYVRGGLAAYRDELDAMLVPWLLEHTKSEIYHQGQALGIATCPSMTPEDVVNSAQLNARKYFVEVAHPLTGKFTYPGSPVKATGIPWQAGSAPLLGQHNEEVYARLGYSKEDLSRLRAQQVI